MVIKETIASPPQTSYWGAEYVLVSSLHGEAENLCFQRVSCSKRQFSSWSLLLPWGALCGESGWTWVPCSLHGSVRNGEQAFLPLNTVLPTLQHLESIRDHQQMQYVIHCDEERKTMVFDVLSQMVGKWDNRIRGRTGNQEEWMYYLWTSITAKLDCQGCKEPWRSCTTNPCSLDRLVCQGHMGIRGVGIWVRLF